jgi:DNA repair protein RadC
MGAAVRSIASARPFTRLERDPDEYREVLRRARELGPIVGPEAAAWVMMPRAAAEVQECAWIMVLDLYAFLLGVTCVARGAVDHVDIEIPTALAAAVRQGAGARYVILFHNHPSGFADPSEDDARLTWDTEEAASQVGLYLLDHVVLGLDEAFSFREQRKWTVR